MSEKEIPFAKYGAEYIGGHPMYLQRQEVMVLLGESYMRLWGGGNGIDIPYRDIKRVGNATSESITNTRLFMFGAAGGLFLEKRKLYTVIDYIDSIGDKISIVLDFHRKIDQAQSNIYLKMVAARTKTKTEEVEFIESISKDAIGEKGV
jgi:hypothetical protein